MTASQDPELIADPIQRLRDAWASIEETGSPGCDMDALIDAVAAELANKTETLRRVVKRRDDAVREVSRLQEQVERLRRERDALRSFAEWCHTDDMACATGDEIMRRAHESMTAQPTDAPKCERCEGAGWIPCDCLPSCPGRNCPDCGGTGKAADGMGGR